MRSIVAVAVLACVLTVTVRGQCFGDDGFSIPGTCCTPATPNLPPFPSWFMFADGASIRDCGVEAVFPVLVNLSAPFPFFNDVYVTQMTCAGAINLQPTFVVMKYARTWTQPGVTGVVAQVWRFLVNVDVMYNPAAPAPVPVPPCAAAGLNVHYVGSIDYSLECNAANPIWNVALNLTHHCGDMSHGPWSSNFTATANHPDRLYAIVGPAPFNYAATAPLNQAMMTADAMRSTLGNLGTLTWINHSELFVLSGQSLLVNNDCACSSIATPPPRWERHNFRIDYGCSTATPQALQSIAWPPVAPTGFNVFPLGTYAVPPGVYPGPAHVSVCWGVATGPDQCGFNMPIHLLHGIYTSNPVQGTLFSTGATYNDFLDVEDMLVVNLSGPSMNLGYGALFLSTMLWSVNM
jgi:hypothetical protein